MKNNQKLFADQLKLREEGDPALLFIQGFVELERE
jgi:hypothetical protein